MTTLFIIFYAIATDTGTMMKAGNYLMQHFALNKLIYNNYGYTMNLMKITPHLSKSEMACLLANPFTLPSMATTFEAEIGEAILMAERKAKHVQNIPNMGTNFGARSLNAEKWLIKVRELVSALEGRPPQSRFQLGVILGCTKETAVRRAQEAIKQGLVCRITAKGHSAKDPMFRYTLVNVHLETTEKVAYMQAKSHQKS
jgi:hypothetical protein